MSDDNEDKKAGELVLGALVMWSEQYGVIVGYLKAAIEVLPKAECQLLLEFAEIAKNHCEQLHRTIGERLSSSRKSA